MSNLNNKFDWYWMNEMVLCKVASTPLILRRNWEGWVGKYLSHYLDISNHLLKQYWKTHEWVHTEVVKFSLSDGWMIPMVGNQISGWACHLKSVTFVYFIQNNMVMRVRKTSSGCIIQIWIDVLESNRYWVEYLVDLNGKYKFNKIFICDQYGRHLNYSTRSTKTLKSSKK
jgi:hypothetical protein